MDGRRWSSYQPNVPGRGIVAGYTARFWAIVVLLGVITGVLASALVELLRLVEHIAYGYRRGPFLDGVKASVGWRHFVALETAAVIVIVSGLVLGRPRGSEATEVSESLWLSEGRLPLLSSLARGAIAIITVGLGSSMGRESAPQLAGSAVASWLSEFEQLPVWQRRLLVASGAGAGFAAIYDVPLGGALFALEVLLGTVALPFVLPALATSVISTAVAWITLGIRPTYSLPHYLLHPGPQLLFALLAGPIIGFAAVGWVRAVKLATRLRPKRWGRFVAPVVVFGALAVVSLQYPELLGNGKGVVQAEALGSYSFGLLVVLLALKPLATTACLAAGSPGGLFTPEPDDRGPAVRSAGHDLEPHLGRCPGRRLRGDRWCRVPGGGDAGAAVGGRADAGADPQLRLADGPDAAGGHDRDRALPAARRAVDLLRPPAARSGRADGPVSRRGGDQHAGSFRRRSARR